MGEWSKSIGEKGEYICKFIFENMLNFNSLIENQSINCIRGLKHKNKKLAFTRFKKVTIHEFGHNLGLPHCPNKKCVMTAAAEKISTIDNENLALCKSCKNKIN